MSRSALHPELLLSAYAAGIFPMADARGRIAWFQPQERAVLPLDGLRVSRSLRATLRKGTMETRLNTCFEAVMGACADREEGTWISPGIRRAYHQLHRLGYAHSVESWRAGRLVGGLYGVCLGGAFFGESMFHTATDASKVALVSLVERLNQRGFVLLDCQYITPHLRSLGAVQISRESYEQRLKRALSIQASFV